MECLAVTVAHFLQKPMEFPLYHMQDSVGLVEYLQQPNIC